MKITKRQLKRIIREEYSRLKRRGLIKEAWSSMPGWEQDLEDRADMLNLERSDALMGAALEIEMRDSELKFLGRDRHSGADVYLRNDNTYFCILDGDILDGLSEEELIAVLDGRY
jgi:hypothetical protein